jgi:hypothetical protein
MTGASRGRERIGCKPYYYAMVGRVNCDRMSVICRPPLNRTWLGNEAASKDARWRC